MSPYQYYSYLESLAANHTDVNHSSTTPHYFRGELEEFYMDLRNKVSFPAVVAEGFEISFPDGDKTRETSFIIANSYSEVKNWESIFSALSVCETIGDEFLRRMLHDEEDSDSFCVNVEPVSATPIINDQCLYVGMRYTIRLNESFSEDVDSSKWTDI